MSTLRALLNGFGTLTIDPSPQLRHARTQMAARDAAQREAWSRSLYRAYHQERRQVGSQK